MQTPRSLQGSNSLRRAEQETWSVTGSLGKGGAFPATWTLMESILTSSDKVPHVVSEGTSDLRRFPGQRFRITTSVSCRRRGSQPSDSVGCAMNVHLPNPSKTSCSLRQHEL